jgi:adenosylcobinamide-GDP ribazoletransferase
MKDELNEKNAINAHVLAAEFTQCLTFLTRIPAPTALPPDQAPLHRAMRQFPLVGALIGGVTSLIVALGTSVGLSPFAAAVLGIAVTAALTGGLHEDGLADTADGFGGGSDKEHKLKIMRDSRIGAYGVLALILVILLKSQAIAAMAAQPAWLVFATLAATGGLSRTLMVWLMRTSLPARGDGLAAAAGQPSRATMMYALGIGLGLAGLASWLSVGLPGAIVVLATGFALAAALRSLANRQIGGYTGDVCGAVQMISETAMLTAASAMIG